MSSLNKSKKRGSIKNKEDLTKRIPRPFGLTLALIRYRQSPLVQDKEDLIRIKERVIEQWTSNNNMINERIYTLDQLATYLNMNPTMIIKHMWKTLRKLGKVFDQGTLDEKARVLWSVSLFKILEIGSEHAQQVQILKTAQGGVYKPFVSSTLNQALGNWNQSQTGIHNLLKMLLDKNPTNILIQNYLPNGQPNNATENMPLGHKNITTTEALKLINSNQKSMLEDTNLADQIGNPNELPDVNPRTQNVSLITQPKTLIHANPAHHAGTQSDTNPTDNPTLFPSNPLPNPIKPTHQERREIKEQIMDEDEFKA